jgi:N-acetylglucosaminyl-diphospho-decaprenol L-rhamnosyltransferase
VSATVIVPSWNGARRLQRLLPSLGGGSELVVVDNGSTDGTADLLARRFPDVEVIRLARNHGFSKAVNRAAAASSSETIVLVNDDCVCEPGFAARLAGAVDPSRGVTMAAGVLLEALDPTVIDSAGLELDDTLLVFDYLNGHPVGVLDRKVADPLGPSAAAAAFDRSAFLECGGFDERLFAYWEDVDLVLRLRLAGARCVLVPDARAVHAHSATLGSGSPGKNYLTGFGRGYVLRKWGVLTGTRGAVALSREAGICAAQLVVDRTPAGIRGRLAGWRAAGLVPRRPYPSSAVGRSRRSVAAELRRRANRRRRLQRGAASP